MEDYLESPHIADTLIEYLVRKREEGYTEVIYNMDRPISCVGELECCRQKDAPQILEFYSWSPEEYSSVPINIMIDTIKREQEAKIPQPPIHFHEDTNKTDNVMNKNNLENLRDELRELRFDKKLADELQKNMEKNLPEFQLRTQLPGSKGEQADFTLHFKQSAQSDYYFFNKYDVKLNKNPLEEGQKYLVISPGDQGKPVFRKFDNPNEAIDYFKGQKGNSELASGKDPGHKTTLATMENDKVNFVAKDFQKAFYTPAVAQTVYVEKGKGFTADQAANLIQGRAVYRDDLLNVGGIPYKAWVALDFDKPKDRSQNYQTRQFHDPSYGFDLSKTLDKFNIKELEDPAKRQKLEESLRNGNRPLITTMKEGQETKLFIEAVPRYSQVNFYQENGKPEKREQFIKDPLLEKTNVFDRKLDKEQNKEVAESQGMKL